MNQTELKKCNQLFALYKDTIEVKEDFYIAKTDKEGIFLIQYLQNNGCAEQAFLCRNAEAVYHYLEEDWEADWLFAYRMERNWGDMSFHEIKENLPQDKKKELEALHFFYQKNARKILEEK